MNPERFQTFFRNLKALTFILLFLVAFKVTVITLFLGVKKLEVTSGKMVRFWSSNNV